MSHTARNARQRMLKMHACPIVVENLNQPSQFINELSMVDRHIGWILRYRLTEEDNRKGNHIVEVYGQSAQVGMNFLVCYECL